MSIFCGFGQIYDDMWASQVSLVIKNPPDIRDKGSLLGSGRLTEEGVAAHSSDIRDIRDKGSLLGSGRLTEEGVAAHSSILEWRIPWTEEPGRLQFTVSQSKTQLG